MRQRAVQEWPTHVGIASCPSSSAATIGLSDTLMLLLLPMFFVQVDATFLTLSCCSTSITCYIKSGGCVMH
jgi:hypothetical protein